MKVQVKYVVLFSVINYITQFKAANKIKDITPNIINSKVKGKRVYKLSAKEKEELDYDLTMYSHKYLTELNKEQLLELFNECCFRECCDTMGSITLEYGHLPAISFTYYNEGFGQYEYNAYISPLILITDDEVNSNIELKDNREQILKLQYDKLYNTLLESDCDIEYLINNLKEEVILDNWDNYIIPFEYAKTNL